MAMMGNDILSHRDRMFDVMGNWFAIQPNRLVTSILPPTDARRRDPLDIPVLACCSAPTESGIFSLMMLLPDFFFLLICGENSIFSFLDSLQRCRSAK